MTPHAETIANAVMAHGVVWHLCEGCGLPWPFPKGFAPHGVPTEREWRCHRCVQILWLALAQEDR
jgi:hypothetical protein